MKDKKAGEVSYRLSVAPLFARPFPPFPGQREARPDQAAHLSILCFKLRKSLRSLRSPRLRFLIAIRREKRGMIRGENGRIAADDFGHSRMAFKFLIQELTDLASVPTGRMGEAGVKG
jgi:hypothetical protein